MKILSKAIPGIFHNFVVSRRKAWYNSFRLLQTAAQHVKLSAYFFFFPAYYLPKGVCRKMYNMDKEKNNHDCRSHNQSSVQDLKVVEPSANRAGQNGAHNSAEDIIPDEVPRRDGPGGEDSVSHSE